MAKKIWEQLQEQEQQYLEQAKQTKQETQEKFEKIASKNDETETFAINRNNSNNVSIWDRVKYVAKRFGNETLGGVTSIGEAETQTIANNLQRGRNKKISKNITNNVENLFNIANPLGNMNRLFKNNLKDSIENITDKNKTFKEKVVAQGLNSVSNAQSVLPVKNALDDSTQLLGKILPEQASEKVLKAGDKISEPYYKNNEKLNEEAQKYGTGTNLAGEILGSVGRMVPSIAGTAITKNPNVGLALMGTGAKGSATKEALNKGKSLDEAVKIGDTQRAIEIGTEMISGGLNIFGKGALDDIVEKGISTKVKSNVGKFLAKQGYNLGGEVLEETISDVLDTFIKQGTTDKNATYSLKDFGDTAVTTMLSTLVLNTLTGGLAGDIKTIKNENKANQNAQNWVSKAQEIVNQTEEQKNSLNNIQDRIDNANIDTTEKVKLKESLENYTKNNEVTNNDMQAIETTIEALENKSGTTNNKIISPEQQINQTENKVAQNQMSEEQRQQRIKELKSINTSEMKFLEKSKIKSEIKALEEGYTSVDEWRKANEIKKQEAIKEYNKKEIDKELEEDSSSFNFDNHKQQQLDIINKNNPADDDMHTWIRSVDDIKSFEEAFYEGGEYSGLDPDFTEEMAEKSKETGKITVYSSYPIKQGTFISPSIMEASQYAGGDSSKLYSKEVNIDDVAWIDGAEGQYAKVENNQNSLYNNIKIGETKNIKIDDISQLIGQGGYRTEEQINSLREDIKKNGITAPIEIYIKNDGTIAIENGNHRLQIARELGIKDIPVKMVDSWENIGLNKENISKENIEEAGGIYNDGDRKNDNNINETSRNRVRSMYNYNEQSQDIGTTKEDVNIPTTESNINEQTGSIRSKENNRKQIENSNESSFILPTKQKANLPLSEKKIETQQNTSEILIPMSDTLKQRKHYKTIMNSSNVTPEARKIAKELIGNDTYVPQNNVNQLENADKRIIKNGADNEAIALRTKVSNGDKITPDDIATGERLIQYYSKTGNKEMLQDTIQNVALAGTQAGQTVQAMSLIHRQTPEGQAMYIQKIVDNMNKEIENRTKGKGKQFDLTPDMIEKIVNSKGKEQLHDNIEAVAKELGQQVPKTTIEKIDSWRYFSMLGNPRTHIRNIIGNLSMGKVQGISNKVAGTIEAVAQKTGIIEERTKTIVPASLETKKFAKEDVKNVMDRLDNGGKFDAKNLIQQYQRTFKSNILENTLGKLYNLNSKALELEDVFGLKSAYKKHLADYMTANKLTSEYFKTGSKESNIKLEKARQYAIQKAQEATFHQVSSLSSLLSQFENKNKFTKLAIGAVIPFKKTPINVAKTGIEYSPVGLVKAFTLDIANLNKGKINANQYIDNLAKGLTGTGITMVGYALAQAGILKASGGSDDEKKTKYDEDRGKQAFSLKIGDKTYTLDWLSPTAIPLFIGAELNNNIKSSEEEQTKEDVLDKISNSIDAFSSAMNPMIEMSMLSGLASTIKSFSQGDTQVFQNLAINAGKSYVNQFVPTISGQIARTIDDTERSTTSTKKNAFSKAVDSTGKQILSKIPVASKLLPAKTDVWGNEQKRDGNVLMRGLQQMAFPWYDKTVKSTKVDNAISDLYEVTGEKSVLPNVTLSSKDFTINKQKYRMTSEEFAQYKKSYGKVSYELLNSLVNSNNYKKMTNEQKKKAIKEIYSYANENNKINYAKSKDLKVDESTIYKTVKAVKKSGGEIKDYFNYIGSTEGLNKDKEKLKVLSDANYSDNTKSAIYSNTIGEDDDNYNNILKKTNIDINEYLKYKQQKLESDKKDDGTLKGKPIANSKKDKTYNYINSMNINYDSKLLLLGMQYKLTTSEREKVVKIINNLPDTSKNEKLEIYDKMQGFTVYKNGTIKF